MKWLHYNRIIGGIAVNLFSTAYIITFGSSFIWSALILALTNLSIILGGIPGSLKWFLFSRRPIDVPKQLSWNQACFCGLIFVCPVILLMSPYTNMAFLFDQFAFTLILLYIAGKLGCAKEGCCGWKNSADTCLFNFIPLQIVEAGCNIFLVIVLIWLQTTKSKNGVFFLLGIGFHLLMRYIFLPFRSSRMN